VGEGDVHPESAAVDGKGAEPGGDAAHASVRTTADVDIADSWSRPIASRRGARIILPAAVILGEYAQRDARGGL
jgi:hypothetical protein